MAVASGLLAVLHSRRSLRATEPANRPRRAGVWREIRLALTPQLALLCIAAMLGYLSLNGVGFLVALSLAAAHALGPAESGVLLSAFGLTNMVTAGPAGAAVDRLGSTLVSAAGVLLAAVVLVLLPFVPGTLAVGALLLLE